MTSNYRRRLQLLDAIERWAQFPNTESRAWMMTLLAEAFPVDCEVDEDVSTTIPLDATETAQGSTEQETLVSFDSHSPIAPVAHGNTPSFNARLSDVAPLIKWCGPGNGPEDGDGNYVQDWDTWWKQKQESLIRKPEIEQDPSFRPNPYIVTRVRR